MSRSPSIQSQPLLTERPPSYQTIVASEDSHSLSSETTCDGESPQANALSKTTSETIWILAGLWSAVFLGALDGTVVATLLSPIGSHFNKSNLSSALGTAYLLAVCCFTPLYGRLADTIGRRGAMLLALTLFGSGTIFCGFAPSMESLIVARAVAGMGGGGVMTVSSIVVTDLIPLKQRGMYQGMANVLFGLGAGIGGPLGGFINDTFGWRAAFYFQTPLLLFSFVIVALKVNIPLSEEMRSLVLVEKLRRIDYMGSLTLVGAVGTLLLAFTLKTSAEMAWSHPLVYGLFIACFLFSIAFVLVEKHYSPYPVMPLRLITQRTPLAIAIANLFGSMAAFSMIYNVPMYFSAVRLYSSAESGLHLLPHSVAISVGSVFAGWVMRKTGKLYTLTLISSAMTIVATSMVASWNDDTSDFHLWFDVVPQAFGMASLITTTLIAMIAGVLKEDMAIATGITYLFRTTGQVLGVSLAGAILQAVLLGQLRARLTGPGSIELIEQIRHSTAIISSLAPEDRKAAVASYAVSLRVVFIFQAVCNFIAFLACLPIQEHQLPGSREEQERYYREQQERQRTDTES